MLESTPRSTLYHVYNRRWERSCKKVFDLDFQGHAKKIEFFHYHRWISWPRKHTHEKYFQKIRTGRQKSRGGCINPPLGRFRLAKYLGHLRVNNINQSCPRVGCTRGSGRVGSRFCWILSGRVSTSDFLVFYWLFLGTWIDMNFRMLHSDWLIFYDI